MVAAMKAVASMDVELTVEERNLLSVAYKNVIGARRASWRIISSIEQKEENKASEEKLKMIRTYRDQVRHLVSDYWNCRLMIVQSSFLEQKFQRFSFPVPFNISCSLPLIEIAPKRLLVWKSSSPSAQRRLGTPDLKQNLVAKIRSSLV
jgi:hypothetical protein